MRVFIAAIFCLTLFSNCAQAQIYADIETTEGTFTIDLDYVNAPKTVANFIGLASGDKSWIDSTTGAVRVGVPYYNGIIFHRVIAGFVNQAGSQRGDGSDGPGYTFPDELVTSDFTDPYLMAMANSGPQTNGSQFFITVGSPTNLNGIHTVFGTVPLDDGPDGIIDGSRSVIDLINAVPTNNERPINDIVIRSITVRRIGSSALAFDETAQNLPVVNPTQVTINTSLLPTDVALDFTQPPGSTFSSGISPDLSNWTLQSRYLGPEATSPLSSFPLGDDQTTFDRHFYLPALVTWPSDAIFVSSLANRTFTLTTAVDPITPFTFTFDSSGVTGTWDYPNPSTPLSGNITNSVFTPNGYGGRVAMLLSGVRPDIWQLTLGIEIGASTPTDLIGRTTGSAQDSINNSSLNVGGPFTLSR